MKPPAFAYLAPATIDGLLARFCNVLRAVVRDAGQPLSRIAVLNAADWTSLVVDANRTKADYPANETVTQIFADQVTRSPHATADDAALIRPTFRHRSAGAA